MDLLTVPSHDGADLMVKAQRKQVEEASSAAPLATAKGNGKALTC
jgi:hypothetical protein